MINILKKGENSSHSATLLVVSLKASPAVRLSNVNMMVKFSYSLLVVELLVANICYIITSNCVSSMSISYIISGIRVGSAIRQLT